jgi:dihydrodipicolinate synthase/N-acetylneuraminate lyase
MGRAGPISMIAALLTPFDDRGRVDHEALRAHVDYLVSEGIDGIMPCGTTGEGPLLEVEEAAAVVEEVVKASGGSLAVVAHVGRPATDATVQLAHRAIDAGASAVSAVVPYYYSLDEGQVIRHYRSLVHAVGETPAYAYNIPSRTGNDLSAPAVQALSDEGVAGLKDSTKSFDRHLDYLRAAPDGFDVFMGSDAMVLDALRAGAAGAVSAVANLRPDLFVALKKAVADGDDADATAMQDEIARVREQVSRGPALTGLKGAVADHLRARGNVYPTGLRAPLG